ncbi:hypothetical protein JX265_009400 [Neoarthrinium moseri]|uniref:Sphingoid long-chain base transporter RSB1 n=1 Tax=Neoarthrinium moseri TaxID=1658444 RepID=A0A9P9WGI5_9PEZI|nr:hypothetical protein JX265_009400 [Neoarthrinium moseri]
MADNSTEATFDAKSCTIETCPIETSYYEYRPSLAANVALPAIFAASFIGFALTKVFTRRSRGLFFTFALLLGLAAEIVGYIGRVMSYNDPWESTGFMIQICCLTIAPAFISAGIYVSLRPIIAAFGNHNSRIPSRWYTRIFIPCDVVSLILQGTGGGLAAAGDDKATTDNGTDIMIAGLVFQVVTLLVFIGLCVDFSISTFRNFKVNGSTALNDDPAVVNIRRSVMFRGFLAALALSTTCVFIRCVYRVAELSEGWTGPIMAREDLFIAFEGGLISVAVLVLNVFNPIICCGSLLDPQTQKGLKVSDGEYSMKSLSDGRVLTADVIESPQLPS